MSRYSHVAARHFWALAVRLSRSGNHLAARRFSRLAGELLGVELAAPVSVGFGGVR